MRDCAEPVPPGLPATGLPLGAATGNENCGTLSLVLHLNDVMIQAVLPASISLSPCYIRCITWLPIGFDMQLTSVPHSPEVVIAHHYHPP